MFSLRQRLLTLFKKAATRLITRMRAGKRLGRIKGRFKDENVRTKEDAKRMVKEDWKTAQNVRLKEDENEEDIKHLKFKFKFVENTIATAQMKLPVAYDFTLQQIGERVDAQPPINFDDLVPYEQCEVLDYEMQFYSKYMKVVNLDYREDIDTIDVYV